ncbi:MAG: FAD-binding oxidoreductase [Anaerolineae bacterium]
MRRWNGWGDDAITYPLPKAAGQFLRDLVGPGTRPRDATWPAVMAALPRSRLIPHPLVFDEPADRVRHSRGQSLPDWIALRSGRLGALPDGVAYPTSDREVRALIAYAQSTGTRLIPYGGGTSVVGHINPLAEAAPVVTVDMGRLNGLLHLDERNHLATFGAGISGPDLEAHLRGRGFTLGHFPQSFEYSTLGGWIVTRSSGQQSLGFGRIERLFAGGHLEAPAGVLDLPAFPASAAGPDLREIVLGSEGRLGILTTATVRITPVAACEDFRAVFFPDFESGQAAVRAIAQSRTPLSMLRLSTTVETQTSLALAGHRRLIAALARFLAVSGIRDEKCMLILGFSGSQAQVKLSRQVALSLARQHGGVHVGRTFGQQWHKNRFRAPYLRNTLWDMGYALDTVETVTDWATAPALIAALDTTLHRGLQDSGERTHVFTHLSHTYPSGASVYTTYLYRVASDPEETLRRWQVLKEAASQVILQHGGTISHQHGVGLDHKSYLAQEKGALGMAVLGDLCRRFDPDGLLNPGKLIA